MASQQRRNQQHIVLGEKRSTTDLAVSHSLETNLPNKTTKRQKQKYAHVAAIETPTSYTTGKYVNLFL